MSTTRLIMVGGFLGAGKTTLLFETTKLLMAQGKRVGLITNDQAPELVDTALLLQTAVKVAEVSGSCFCCNYNGFIQSIREVKAEAKAEVIIAEPVGSCTDLSATLMQPLKEWMNTELQLTPLTVLAEPKRLDSILAGGLAGLHPSAAYIYRKQLEEADVILITKTDTLQASELLKLKTKVHATYPEAELLTVSSFTGEGIPEWLNFIFGSKKAGDRLVEVDYERYAEGEAVLGWLNSTLTLQGQQVDWDHFGREFMESLSKNLDSQLISVGHVKMMVENGTNYLVGNLTGNIETLNFRESAGKSNEARLRINARIGVSPESLDRIIEETLTTVSAEKVKVYPVTSKCLSPGFPNPTHRYQKVFPTLQQI